MPVKKCFVDDCESRSSKAVYKTISFHKFRNDTASQWLSAIGKKDIHLVDMSNYYICSKHFLPDDFEATYNSKYRILKKGIIPSQNLNNNGKCSRTDNVILNTPESNENVASTSKLSTILENKGQLIDIDDEVEFFLGNDNMGKRNLKRHCVTPEPSINFLQPFPSPPKKKCLPSRGKIHKSSSSSSIQSSASETTRNIHVQKRNVRIFHSYSHSPNYLQKDMIRQKEKRKVLQKSKQSLEEKLTRLRNSLKNAQDIITYLKKQQDLSDIGLSQIQSAIDQVPQDLFQRFMRNSINKRTTTKKYSKELRSFALTLHFYSPKAYEYVRKIFRYALPAPSVIRSWIGNVKCEPGFNETAFVMLKEKADEYKLKGQTLLCSLMLDEMAIRQHVDLDGTKFYGYVDIGSNVENDDGELATEALVFMAVAINGNFKIPVAYFFIKSMSGQERANIVNEILIRLHQANIRVISLTCDAPAVHVAMFNCLGCKILSPPHLKNYFEHPVDGTKIYAIFDVCHLLKIMRNNWAKMKVILDPDSNKIEWELIEKLYEVQEVEGLHCANKLTKRHIEWQKQIMKVKLAAQTVSASVGDSLEFVAYDLGIKEFSNAQATIKFIRVIDKIFDILNSKNPFGKGFKKPLRQNNEHYFKPVLTEAIDYLANCKNSLGQNICVTKNKTPFVGFIVSISSILDIYETYVVGNYLNYLLTYKMSQDHLELFFSCIRSRQGWNNNPTCLQFVRSMKRLLMHIDVKVNSGNCTIQDNTTMLNTSILSKAQKLSYIPSITYTSTDIHMIKKYGLYDAIVVDENEENMFSYGMLSMEMTEFTHNVVSYIAGFVVRKAKTIIKCFTCLDALEEDIDSSKSEESHLKLIMRKQRGGLIVPSKSVIKICDEIEKKLKTVHFINDGKLPIEKRFMEQIISHIGTKMFTNNSVFQKLEDHVFDQSVGEMVHRRHVINVIACLYIKIRLHYWTKKETLNFKKEQIRQKYTKLILFNNQ